MLVFDWQVDAVLEGEGNGQSERIISAFILKRRLQSLPYVLLPVHYSALSDYNRIILFDSTESPSVTASLNAYNNYHLTSPNGL